MNKGDKYVSSPLRKTQEQELIVDQNHHKKNGSDEQLDDTHEATKKHELPEELAWESEDELALSEQSEFDDDVFDDAFDEVFEKALSHAAPRLAGGGVLDQQAAGLAAWEQMKLKLQEQKTQKSEEAAINEQAASLEVFTPITVLDKQPTTSVANQPIAEEAHSGRSTRTLPRSRNKRFIGYVAVSIASMLLGAFLLGSPEVSKALPTFYQKIIQLPNEMASFIWREKIDPDVTPLTSAPENNNSDDLQQNEAVFPNIYYMPERYSIEQTKITDNNKIKYFVYTTNNGEKTRIVMELLANNVAATTNNDPQETDSEYIDLAYGKGLFNMSPNGEARLHFIWDKYMITIIGVLTKEEVITIANSFKMSF